MEQMKQAKALEGALLGFKAPMEEIVEGILDIQRIEMERTLLVAEGFAAMTGIHHLNTLELLMHAETHNISDALQKQLREAVNDAKSKLRANDARVNLGIQNRVNYY